MNKISIIHYYYSYLNGKSILFSFSSVNSLFSNIEYITSLSLSFIFILYYSVMSIDRVNHVCLNKIEILISYKFIYRYIYRIFEQWPFNKILFDEFDFYYSFMYNYNT